MTHKNQAGIPVTLASGAFPALLCFEALTVFNHGITAEPMQIVADIQGWNIAQLKLDGGRKRPLRHLAPRQDDPSVCPSREFGSIGASSGVLHGDK